MSNESATLGGRYVIVGMSTRRKEPPESAGSASGWTSEDAEKLLAYLGGSK